MTTTLKTCFKCNMEKSAEAFYRHSAMSDGRLGKCIECTKKDASDHRLKNIEEVRKYDRERSMLPHRKELRARISSEWAKQNSVRRSAQHKLNNSVRDGKIEKPEFCSHCGYDGRIEAHHPDYARPLLVEWLCVPCHRQAHALAKKAA